MSPYNTEEFYQEFVLPLETSDQIRLANYIISQIAEPQSQEYENQLAIGRYGMPTVKIGQDLYILGGSCEEGIISTLEKYNPQTEEIFVIENPLIPRRYHTAQPYKNKIIIFGGQNERGLCEPTVEIYDTYTHSIGYGSPMPNPRYFVSSVILDDKIFVIGGTSIKKTMCQSNYWPETDIYDLDRISVDKVTTPVVEVYDISQDRWEQIAPMPTARQCDAVLADRRIYTVGGFNGRYSTACFEVYDIDRNTWEKLPDLPCSMSAHRLAVFDNKILAFGDYYVLDRVLLYDIARKKWQELDIDFLPARHSSVICHDSFIYIFGGNVATQGSHLTYIQKLSASDILASI